MAIEHPSADRLRAFAAGLLTVEEITAIEAHISTCDICLAQLGALPNDDPLERELHRDGAVPGSCEPATEGPGSVIGPYKLLQGLGEGGMGTVFMAEQREPVQRRVALKIVKPGMDSRQVVARFEAERQALALMDHPNIAKVFDAGATQSGRPFFVMELVKGMPITRFCDREQLTPRERLELFVPVCQAVQHAHQKGIIHRDLKPSNILVTLYDGRPVPKVIDFGVAKATGHKLTERTMFTEIGAAIGTLEYMSPEQAELNQLDVDTRSDIYSLGAVLYELLTGTVPFPSKMLREAGYSEMMRILRESEPHRPSTRLSNTAELPAIASRRKTEPKRLARLVQGDLDWIVMKCLEKERSRRYETANGLAMDIQRYLQDEPVFAGPPSAAYRVRKFLRRNKGPVIAATLLVLALTAGFVGTAVGLVRARSAEKLARDRLFDVQQASVAVTKATQKTVEAETARTDSEVARQQAEVLRTQALLKEHESSMRNARLMFPGVSLGLNELRAVLGDTRFRHWHSASSETGSSIDFSPDDKTIAVASWDHTIGMWDTETGHPLRFLHGHHAPVESVAFHPNGNALASGDREGSIKIWDLDTERELKSLNGHTGYVAELAFTLDGKTLVSCGGDRDGTVRVWDWRNGSGRELRGHTSDVRGIAVSRDGKYVASAGGDYDSFVRIWDISDLKNDSPVATLRGDRGDFFNSVAFSPDGRWLATADCNSKDRVRIWDWKQGTVNRKFDHPGWVWSVRFSPDGRFLVSAGGEDHPIYIWDLMDNRPAARIHDHRADRLQIAFAHHSPTFASAGADGSIKLWNVDAEKSISPGDSGQTGLRTVAFRPDGQVLASAGEDQTVRIWDRATGEVLSTCQGHNGPVYSVVFSPDGKFVASAGYDKTVRMWDASAGTSLLSLPHPSRVYAVAFNADGSQLVSGAEDGTVRRWDVPTGQFLPTFEAHRDWVLAIAFSPDGKLFASGGRDRTVRMWNATTGKLISTLDGYTYPVTSVAFSPDGRRIAAACNDELEFVPPPQRGNVSIRDVADGSVIGILDGPMVHVQYSADGSTVVASCSDGKLRLLDPDTAVLRRAVRIGPGGAVIRQTAHNYDRLNAELATANSNGTMYILSLSDLSPRPIPEAGLEEILRLADSFSDNATDTASPSWLAKHIALMRQENWEEAAVAYANAVKASNAIDLAVGADWTERQRGALDADRPRWLSLANALSEPLESGGRTWWLWRARGLAYAATQQYDKAAHDFANATQIKPDDWDSWRALARAHADRWEKDPLLSEHPRWNRVVEDCSRVLRLKSDWQNWYLRGLAAMHLNRRKEAEESFSKAVQIEPSSRPDWNFLGHTYAELGKWQDALAAFSKVVELDDKNQNARRFIALTRLQLGDATAYRSYCSNLLEQFAQAEDPHGAGEVARICSLMPETVADLNRPVQLAELSLEHDRVNCAPLHSLGAALYRAGIYQTAIERLNDAENRHGSDAEPWDLLFLAMAHQRLERADEARKILQQADQAIERRRNHPHANWVYRLELEVLRDEAETLIGPTRRAKTILPTSEREPQAWHYTFEKPGDGWEQTGFDDHDWQAGPGGFGREDTPGAVVRTEWRGAEIWLRRAFDLSQLPTGNLRLRLHHDEDAEIYVNGHLVISIPGYTTRYEEFELPPSAIKQLRHGANTVAIHCRNTSGGQYIDCGLLEVDQSPTDESNPDALNNASWRVVATPDGTQDQYRDALRRAQAACRMAPDNGDILYTLGVAQYRVGQHAESLQTLGRADELHRKQPAASHPADVAFLAMAHQRLGHADEARKLLERLRALLQDDHWKNNAECQTFLREAESLIDPRR